ncbi:hypothetical protein [Mangrovimonas futianensis]|uniref:FEKKY domain-containing protein n=1 Tax=Mangrovimonas futianensis TaxID=2895523 RepID=UPI001E44B495|nr:hypothetical protein [Mangrovimonas futianensis]MCF1422092.1 hypothetical protein [Mangrovimonas futianensis]
MSLVIPQFLFSQREIVGKVEFYKSVESEYKILESFPDGTIQNLTNRKHKIRIKQKNRLFELETDSSGIFKFRTYLNDSIHINVNHHSNFFNEIFKFDSYELSDTLKLRISDRKLAVYRDSLVEPEFYNKYSEKQAYIDFNNGIRRLFSTGGFLSDYTIQKNKLLAEKYDLNYEYLFGCIVNRTKIRIVYRYNQVMKKLMGISEKVW